MDGRKSRRGGIEKEDQEVIEELIAGKFWRESMECRDADGSEEEEEELASGIDLIAAREEEEKERRTREEWIKKTNEEEEKKKKRLKEEEELREEAMKRKAKEEKKREQKEKKDRERREEEEIEKEAEEREARVTREKGGNTIRENMDEVRRFIEMAMGAISKESGSKLQFNRGDQATVKTALMGIEGACMGFLVKQIEMTEEAKKWEDKCRKLEAEREVEKREGRRGQAELAREGVVRKARQAEPVGEGAVRGREEEMVEAVVMAREAEPEARQVRRESERESERMNERNEGENGERRETESESEEDGRSFAQVTRGGMRGRGRGMRGKMGSVKGSMQKSVKGSMQKGVTYEGGEGWTTPPKNLEMIISRVNVTDGRRLVEQLARNVDMKQNGGAPRAVRIMRDGKVCIVAKDEGQKERLREQMSRMSGMEVRDARMRDPMIMISGVPISMEEEELLEAIVGENGEIGVGRGSVRVVRKYQCRNPWRRNWIIQLPARGFKALVRRESK